MDCLPIIEACFCIEGKHFNLEQFTNEIEITPTETREIDDWPESIKNNLDLPEDLQPRYAWYLYEKSESCKQISLPIYKIMSKLVGKEQKLIEFFEKNQLQKGLIITIHSEVMNLPEIVLPFDIVSYFGNLKMEIGFDIYLY